MYIQTNTIYSNVNKCLDKQRTFMIKYTLPALGITLCCTLDFTGYLTVTVL